MHLLTDAAAALGSRFNLIFDPREHRVFQNAIGEFRELPLELTVGVRTPEGELWALPFTDAAAHFPFVEQFISATTIEYRAVHPDLWIELRLRLRAPFYPRDARLSCAPFFYVDVQVAPLRKLRWESCQTPLERGELVFELAGAAARFERTKKGISYVFTSTAPARAELPAVSVQVSNRLDAVAGEPAGANAVRQPFELSGGRPARMSLIWSNWIDKPVLQVFGKKTPFKYRQLFDSREAMLRWAVREREQIEARCEVLDTALSDWSLGTAASHLTALALHSFLVNTWWTVRPDGRDWFSVWEGSCLYHSTLDVEYNDAMLYLALWPELLEMLLDEWAEFEVDGQETLGPEGKGTSFLCHDMGSDHVVGKQFYPHHMEVEENANYLLLTAAWASLTGKAREAASRLPLCRRLAQFIVRADSSGDGVPDRGVANTIDDACPALQYGGEQVYLAVKAQAALWALAELEQRCSPRQDQGERWRAFAAKSIKTIEAQAWLADHYAVSLSRTTEGLTEPWTGEPLPPGELAGWDDYSIYTVNGLLLPFIAGLRMPRWKLNRFAEDIENAARATMTPYGCRHSSSAGGAVWFSQNIWRDCVAAYLGIDMLNNVERYWDYQLTTGENWRASLYYDTTEQNNLCFYPRGVTVFGLPLSAAGLSLDRISGSLVLRPVRSTLRVPLLPLADWEHMRVPVLTVSHREGVAIARISERDLLKGLTLTVVGAELDPE